jgi:hypothetical protein
MGTAVTVSWIAFDVLICLRSGYMTAPFSWQEWGFWAAFGCSVAIFALIAGYLDGQKHEKEVLERETTWRYPRFAAPATEFKSLHREMSASKSFARFSDHPANLAGHFADLANHFAQLLSQSAQLVNHFEAFGGWSLRRRK